VVLSYACAVAWFERSRTGGVGHPATRPVAIPADIDRQDQLDTAQGDLVARLVRDKYGLWVPIIEAVYWLGRLIKRQPRPEPAYIEIVDA
jgi:hypothetical protein